MSMSVHSARILCNEEKVTSSSLHVAYSLWYLFYKSVTFKLMGPQPKNMFYLVTQYMYICVNITKVSGKDLYSNYLQSLSLLIFSVLFCFCFCFCFKWWWRPVPLIHDSLMFENLTLHARTSQALMLAYDHLMHHAASFLWYPLLKRMAPTHGYYSFLRTLSPPRPPRHRSHFEIQQLLFFFLFY